MSIEDEIRGKDTEDYTQDYTGTTNNQDTTFTKANNPNNKRGTLMKWAGWLTIVFCALNIATLIFSIIRYSNPNFDWNMYIQSEYGGMEVSVETIKAILIGESIASIVIRGVFIWLGTMYIKDAEIYEDTRFPKNKYIWISVLNIICVSVVSGVIGIVAAVSRNSTEQYVDTNMSTNSTTPPNTDVTISQTMQEKLMKLKKMKEDNILSEDEYKDLVAKVLDGEK